LCPDVPAKGPFRFVDGVYVPLGHVRHRDNEYNEANFGFLLRMQREHFWYIDRHQLILESLLDVMKTRAPSSDCRRP